MSYETRIPWLLQKALTTLKTTPPTADFIDGVGAVVRQTSILDIKWRIEQRLRDELRGMSDAMKACIVELYVYDFFCKFRLPGIKKCVGGFEDDEAHDALGRGINDFPNASLFYGGCYDHLFPTPAETIKAVHIPGYVTLAFDPEEPPEGTLNVNEWDCVRYSLEAGSTTLLYQRYDSEKHPDRNTTFVSRFSPEVLSLLSLVDVPTGLPNLTPANTRTLAPSITFNSFPPKNTQRRLRTRRYGPTIVKHVTSDTELLSLSPVRTQTALLSVSPKRSQAELPPLSPEHRPSLLLSMSPILTQQIGSRELCESPGTYEDTPALVESGEADNSREKALEVTKDMDILDLGATEDQYKTESSDLICLDE